MEQYYLKLVQNGLELLHPVMTKYIRTELKKRLGNDWWNDVLKSLKDPMELNRYGTDEELASSLDKLNCLKIFRNMNYSLYYDRHQSDCVKAWASELLGVRNLTHHSGINDILQPDAERYLDTMVRFAETIDAKCAEKIKALYQEARSTAPDVAAAKPEQGFYPSADQKSMAVKPKTDLLGIVDKLIIEKTGLSRKLTINGETKAYPVYRVRLDKLFYNDRNDRILTWIAQYKDENGVEDFSALSRETYNDVIEKFIIESNPGAIERTKNNIELVNQREPGVVLADGRVIDGNRRFTCLRLLHEEGKDYNYFETVILGGSEGQSEKQIKMLELAIQHGEEQKVDYNLIDLAIGAYLDIVETRLLTINEYASSTNEQISEVKKRLDVAALIVEYLEFMHVPGQFHIAREMQVYSIFNELIAVLNRCKNDKERQAIKRSVFANTMLGVFPDQRKYIRDLKSMTETLPFKSYMQMQNKFCEQLSSAIEEYGIGGMADIEEFIEKNGEMKKELGLSMEKALSQTKKAQTKSKPSKNVMKCIDLLMEIDTGIFEKLSSEERETLLSQLNKLSEISGMIAGELKNE